MSVPGRDNPFLLTRPELLSAKRKIAQVAYGFDPRKISFKGFESHSLDPTTFREQIRHNLLIHLTNAELGALVTLFDKDNDGRVNSAAFISEFLRLGSIERKKVIAHEKECVEGIERRKQKYLEEREKSFEKLRRNVLKTTFTEEEAKSAYEKFSLLAIGHDVYNSSALRGFENGGKLSPIEFREQIRNSFHLHLSRGETAALIHLFDENNDGSIDCDEFIRSFFHIGYKEREKYYHRHLQRTNKIQENKRKQQKKRDEYYLSKVALTLPSPSEIKEEEKVSILSKITQIAINYERKTHWGNIFNPFEYATLRPIEFREILKQQFQLHITPTELSALVEEFGVEVTNNDDNNGESENKEKLINCKEFLSYFFHIGRKEKENLLRKRISLNDKLLKTKIQYEKNLSNKLLDRKITAVEWPVLPEISPGRGDGSNKSEFEKRGSLSSSMSLHSKTMSIQTSNVTDYDDEGSNSNTKEHFEDDFSHHDSISTHLSPSITSLGIGSSSISPTKSRRMYRKPSVLDSISPNREALELIKKERSFINVYPNASNDTKKFLLEIEEQEEAVRKMKKRKKKKKNNNNNNNPLLSPQNRTMSSGSTFSSSLRNDSNIHELDHEYENEHEHEHEGQEEYHDETLRNQMYDDEQNDEQMNLEYTQSF